ncbi:MAG: hypothetical protein IT454_12750 [Planctomycetes bacterium]|nr:hypothetical protein [Planctomycetota bacterium]
MNARALAGMLVAALGAWAVFSIYHTPAKAAVAVAWESSNQCAQCHPLPFDEWKSSWHAQSWTDVEVRKQNDDFGNSDCIDCHAPQPVFETGIGNRVLPRSTRRIEGVDCIACHQMLDGRMAGTVDNPSVACRPLAQRELVRPEFCAGCHNQHGTIDQWKASKYAQPGPDFQDCIACHMPYRDPADPTKGRNHTMHGGHDIELVRRAVTLEVRSIAGAPQVVVRNVGAGHNFPTDERSRASDIFWRPLDGSDTPQPWRKLYRFRNPYRFEVGQPNTELPAGQALELTIEDDAARGAIEVALFFKLTPYYEDPERPDPERESILVHRVSWKP